MLATGYEAGGIGTNSEPKNPIDKYLDSDERFSTTLEIRDFFNLLKKNGIFQNHADAFLSALSLGIFHEKFEEVDRRVDLMILPVYRSADPNGVFPLLAKALHPELDKKQLARRMEAYAVFGGKMLKEQYEKLSRVDFQMFLSLAKG